MNDIEKIKNHLERAYAEVSKLKVSGDVVDTVYEIREALRAAFRVAVRLEEGASSTTPSARSPFPAAAGKALEEDQDGEEEREGEVSADAAAEDEV